MTLLAVDSLGDAVFLNLPSGQHLDIRASDIRATGTTAANIVGLA